MIHISLGQECKFCKLLQEWEKEGCNLDFLNGDPQTEWVLGQFAWLIVGAMLSHGSLKNLKLSLFWTHLESHGCPDGAGGALQGLGYEQGRMREVF